MSASIPHSISIRIIIIKHESTEKEREIYREREGELEGICKKLFLVIIEEPL